MNYTIGDREKVVCVETWESNAVVLDIYDNGYAVHTNHCLLGEAPKTFEMTSEMGGGSYGFTMERLALGKELLADTENVGLEFLQQVFKTRPILVYPGKSTGRTLMQMTVEIPKEGNPVLYLTPDSPNMFSHAQFSFR